MNKQKDKRSFNIYIYIEASKIKLKDNSKQQKHWGEKIACKLNQGSSSL